MRTTDHHNYGDFTKLEDAKAACIEAAKEKDQIVYCEIKTWVGTMAFTAQHYYAKLKNPCMEEIEVKQPVTQEIADKLNGDDDWISYSVGDMTDRFFDMDSLRSAAIVMFKEQCPDATILLEGSRTYCGPKMVLFVPPSIVSGLVRQFKKANDDHYFGIYSHCENSDEIEKAWDAEIKRIYENPPADKPEPVDFVKVYGILRQYNEER